tara:strand:+ start:1363 stop:1734 length:372 start_codon:yes stop_codon:yes gene_type:complete
MAESRAIDQLCKAFNVEQRSSYTIKNGKEVVLKLYWKPLTISDRDRINNSLKALNVAASEDNLDFAIQMVICKAENEAGNRLFSDGDRAKIRNRLPLNIVLDIMSKMQGTDEVEEADDIKSED